MARLWRDLEEENTDYNLVFASEESFGYMTHHQARDKDAVGAMAMMNEITLYISIIPLYSLSIVPYFDRQGGR